MLPQMLMAAGAAKGGGGGGVGGGVGGNSAPIGSEALTGSSSVLNGMNFSPAGRPQLGMNEAAVIVAGLLLAAVVFRKK